MSILYNDFPEFLKTASDIQSLACRVYQLYLQSRDGLEGEVVFNIPVVPDVAFFEVHALCLSTYNVYENSDLFNVDKDDTDKVCGLAFIEAIRTLLLVRGKLELEEANDLELVDKTYHRELPQEDIDRVKSICALTLNVLSSRRAHEIAESILGHTEISSLIDQIEEDGAPKEVVNALREIQNLTKEAKTREDKDDLLLEIMELKNKIKNAGLGKDETVVH